MDMGIKIAVYGIALNEERHAKRWADATRDADLRIVADTGSNDATGKLLQEEGVTVHAIYVTPFRFDDARNAALELLPADIDLCLSLDLDEVPEDDFFPSSSYVAPRLSQRAALVGLRLSLA